jgi:predicted ATPase
VELAALVEAKLVASTIASTLGVKEVRDAPILETLKQHTRDKHLLLVVDNFEHVIDAANDLSQLLTSGQGVKLLVTSRAPLRVRGEREYSVPPLTMPDPRQLPTLEELTGYEAVRLFIERAQGVKADFEVTSENASALAEICVHLDGLPLAIELAAARVKLLSPPELLTRLSPTLKVLTGGARDLPKRQQTLRGAIDWSYDLLDEGEKQLFARMAVFRGGRTLEALEAVCNHDGNLQLDVLDVVQALLNNSLLQQREGSDGEPRFWMLETIHEYAREKLEESGEAAALEMAHALYFMRVAEAAEPYLRGAQVGVWLNRLEDEHDNLRTALRWAAQEGEAIERGWSHLPLLGRQELLQRGERVAGRVAEYAGIRGTGEFFSQENSPGAAQTSSLKGEGFIGSGCSCPQARRLFHRPLTA